MAIANKLHGRWRIEWEATEKLIYYEEVTRKSERKERWGKKKQRMGEEKRRTRAMERQNIKIADCGNAFIGHRPSHSIDTQQRMKDKPFIRGQRASKLMACRLYVISGECAPTLSTAIASVSDLPADQSALSIEQKQIFNAMRFQFGQFKLWWMNVICKLDWKSRKFTIFATWLVGWAGWLANRWSISSTCQMQIRLNSCTCKFLSASCCVLLVTRTLRSGFQPFHPFSPLSSCSMLNSIIHLWLCAFQFNTQNNEYSN